MPKPRHLFFDVDGTLTRSKSRITEDMMAALSFLVEEGYDLVAISGAALGQMKKQLADFDLLYMAQNGNDVPDYWQEPIKDTFDIDNHIGLIAGHTGIMNKMHDKVEHRGCQISLSMVGHNRPTVEKEKYDPDKSIREGILKAVPFVSDEFDVKIAGTTCFDYFRKGRHKGYNIGRLLDIKGWKPEDCLYFGDSLGPNGNDETVVGVIPTQAVKDPKDLLTKLQAQFL